LRNLGFDEAWFGQVTSYSAVNTVKIQSVQQCFEIDAVDPPARVGETIIVGCS
jgi:hypothetical protein